MEDKNINNLKTLFPEMYSKLRYGFEFGNGWYDLVFRLSSKIDELAKRYNLSGDKYPFAVQVKEKFGGLRFYIDPVDEKVSKDIYELINEFELLSLKTCEMCGKSGNEKTNPNGWICTICDDPKCLSQRKFVVK